MEVLNGTLMLESRRNALEGVGRVGCGVYAENRQNAPRAVKTAWRAMLAGDGRVGWSGELGGPVSL